MKTRFFIYFILMFSVACSNNPDQKTEKEPSPPKTELAFDEEKWKTGEEGNYPYRDKMVDNILYNDTIRGLFKKEILDLLGEPDRINGNYLYYVVKRKQLGFWTLHTKTLVFKFYEDDTVEWIKIHE